MKRVACHVKVAAAPTTVPGLRDVAVFSEAPVEALGAQQAIKACSCTQVGSSRPSTNRVERSIIARLDQRTELLKQRRLKDECKDRWDRNKDWEQQAHRWIFRPSVGHDRGSEREED